MGLIRELRDDNIANSTDALQQALRARRGGISGVSVRPENATQIPAVLSAVRCISETMASLPLDLFRRLEDGGKEKADGRPLFNTLKFKPNPEMSSLEFRETMQAWLLTWGNAFANIQRAGNQVVENLWPIPPNRVKVFRNDQGDLRFSVRVPGETNKRIVRPRNMLHIKGLSKNGLVGLSPIQETRRALEMSKAMEKHGAKMFENGAQPSMILKHPNTLQDETRENLREEFSNAYSGLENAHRIAVLEEEMEPEIVQMSSEDLQMIEERQFQLREIARIFRIQPHLIQDLEDATFSNIETQSLEFVKFTLRPWLVRWEQAIRNQLIPETSRDKLFAEFNVDGLLRGDSEMRAEFYRTGFQNGFFSTNDIREMENMNPVEDGDQYLVPKNMVPLSEAQNIAQAEVEDKTSDSEEREITPEDLEEMGYTKKETRQDDEHVQAALERREIAIGFRPVFEDAAGRIVRREVAEVKDLIDKHLPQDDIQAFADDLRELYFEEASGDDSLEFFFKQQFKPHFRTLASQILRVHENEHEEEIDLTASELSNELIEERASKFAGLSVGAMMKDVKEARDITKTRQQEQSPLEAAEEEINRREENRAEVMAKSETHHLEGFVTRSVFTSIGVTRLIWTTVGTNCPLCNELDGTVVGTENPFIQEGDPTGPENFTPNSDVFRPPAHRSCDCVLRRG